MHRILLMAGLLFGTGALLPVLEAADAPVAPLTETTAGAIAADSVLVCGADGKIKIKDTAGKDLRVLKVGGCVHDLKVLPNGNILFANGDAVREIKPDGTKVFEYVPQNKKGGGVYGCQRLENGNTMVAENSTGKILEVSPEGKIVFELQTLNYNAGNHQNLRHAEKLANGNYLVCHSGPKIVREYKPDGTVVQEIKTANLAFSARRKANGNTYVAMLGRIVEYNPESKEVWSFKTDELKLPAGFALRNLTGFTLLKNGNLLVGCYAPHNKQTCGVNMLEITPEKKAVWYYASRNEGSMMGVQFADKSIMSEKKNQP